MKFLVISGEYIFVALNLQMKGTKSRRVIFGHTNGVVFLLQGHYLQGLKIGSKTWCTSKMRGKRYSDTWSSGYGFVARVKWMMLQSSTKTLKKKGGEIWRILGVSWIFGFSKFYKAPFLWTPPDLSKASKYKKTGPAQHIDFKSPGDRHTIILIILRCVGYLSAS